MNAVVLVVGDEQFLATVVYQIRHMISGTVEVSSSLDEAIPLIQTTQPAVVIVQAAQAGSWELCHQIKARCQWSWIYCIVLDDRLRNGNELSADDEQQLAVYAHALENGADAYLKLTVTAAQDSAIACAEIRLLRAQILAGLRAVKFYQELLQTNDVLSTMALADPLTELSNRRAMEWELPRQIQNARTHGTPLSLIMLDVDYFKSVNDTYGHQVGDRVLQLLAARLEHNLRLQDTLFRYGGEEFVIILGQTNTEDALVVAKRLGCLVSEQPFYIDGTLALQITLSLGLATLMPRDDLKGDTLLRRADHNLLQAKSSGRNQVFSGEGGAGEQESRCTKEDD